MHWRCNQGGGWVSTGSVTGEFEFLMLVLQSRQSTSKVVVFIMDAFSWKESQKAAPILYSLVLVIEMHYHI